jgi:hypothetical protein
MTANAPRQPKPSIPASIMRGNPAVASAMPMPVMPTARPRRRTNQTLITCRLTRPRAPCPRPRSSTKPIARPVRLVTVAMYTQAAANPAAIQPTASRGPRRSMERPTQGSAKAPVRVPSVYSSETPERVAPKSSMIGSRKTDTPTVCPGIVIINPSVPTTRITQP